MLFEPGPWDKRAQIDGAHVFSKKRKLLYGAEHDSAEIDAEEVRAGATRIPGGQLTVY